MICTSQRTYQAFCNTTFGAKLCEAYRIRGLYLVDSLGKEYAYTGPMYTDNVGDPVFTVLK